MKKFILVNLLVPSKIYQNPTEIHPKPQIDPLPYKPSFLPKGSYISYILCAPGPPPQLFD